MAYRRETRFPVDGARRENVSDPALSNQARTDCLDCRCLAQFDKARREKSQILFNALPGLS